MVQKELFIDVADEVTRYAATEAGLLVQALAIPRRNSNSIEGIYLGQVVQQVPNLDAVFVEIGGDKPGLLNKRDYPRDIAKLNDGDPVIVQVERNASADKGARLTARPTLVGRYIVFVPGGRGCRIPPNFKDDENAKQHAARLELLLAADEGVVVRTHGVTASEVAVRTEFERLQKAWQAVGTQTTDTKPSVVLRHPTETAVEWCREADDLEWARVVVNDAALANALRRDLSDFSPELASRVEHYSKSAPLFAEAGIEDDWADALEPEVILSGGGCITIDHATALIAIDVDSGAGQSAMKTNLAAAIVIGRQIRLRNLSGQMVVDFISMPKAADRSKVLEALREACAPDRHINVFGYTKMGLVELTRRRRGPSLVEAYRQTP